MHINNICVDKDKHDAAGRVTDPVVMSINILHYEHRYSDSTAVYIIIVYN